MFASHSRSPEPKDTALMCAGAQALTEMEYAVRGELVIKAGDYQKQLADGSADLPYLLTDYHLSVFPANASGDGIDWASGVGTGAFTLDSFEPGIAVRMERNPNYHKNNKPYFDGFELINIPDATARLNALLTGEVHMIGDIDVRNEPLVARNKNLRIERVRAHVAAQRQRARRTP